MSCTVKRLVMLYLVANVDNMGAGILLCSAEHGTGIYALCL